MGGVGGKAGPGSAFPIAPASPWAWSCVGITLRPGSWRALGGRSCLKIVTGDKPPLLLGQPELGGCCRWCWQQCLAALVGQRRASVSLSVPKLPCAGGQAGATGLLSSSLLLCERYQRKKQ